MKRTEEELKRIRDEYLMDREILFRLFGGASDEERGGELLRDVTRGVMYAKGYPFIISPSENRLAQSKKIC